MVSLLGGDEILLQNSMIYTQVGLQPVKPITDILLFFYFFNINVQYLDIYGNWPFYLVSRLKTKGQEQRVNPLLTSSMSPLAHQADTEQWYLLFQWLELR